MFANPRLYLLGAILTTLLTFLFKRLWRAHKRGKKVVQGNRTKSFFAVTDNETVEVITDPEMARAAHRFHESLWRKLGRLILGFLAIFGKIRLRRSRNYAKAEERRLQNTALPPPMRETLRRSFYRLCRDGYQFLRNRWHGFSQWRQRCWQRFQVWRRRKRIDRLPVTNALAQRKRNRILDAAAALLRGDARWRVWLRSIPGIGRWFGSNQQPTAEERTRAERAENRKLYIAGGAILAAGSVYGLGVSFGTLTSILFAYVILLAVRLIVAGKANYVGNRELWAILMWKRTLAIAAIAAVVWFKA